MNKLSLALATTSALVGLSFLSAGHAVAQDNGSAIDRVMDEVFVTGTKSQNVENVQDVAIAMTAYNTETLEALKVRTLEDLSFSSPNVQLTDIATARGTANFAIRGLGVNSSIPSIDPAVGVFIDGVYLGVNSGVVFDMFDLDSVEVLRGPQGLLFGRNTTGGAVLINTGNPTGELRYKMRAAVEGPVDSNRGGINSFLQGVVSGPLVQDVLHGKISAYYNKDDGYFKNQLTGDNIGEAETFGARGALEWFASEDIRFIGKLSYLDVSGDGPVGQNRGLFERDTFNASLDLPGSGDSETIQGSLKTEINVDFGDGLITNIFGYRDYQGLNFSDIDSLPMHLFHSQAELAQEQFSNELRYNGSFGNAEVTTGVYWFQQDVAYDEYRFIPPRAAADAFFPGAPTQANLYGGGEQDHEVFGAFGQLDYSVSEELKVILGLRYSDESKDAGITYIAPRVQCSVVAGTCPYEGVNPVPYFISSEPLIVYTGTNNGFTDSDSWSNWSPKVGLEYLHENGTLFYGNWTRGYRSGGYNFRITDPVAFEAIFPAGSQRSFDEEKVDTYEIGAKYETNDRRLTLNGAAFHTKIGDMQREVNAASGSQGAGVIQTIVNTADADIYGIEADMRLRLLDNLIVTANAGLIDADYQEVGFDISGDGVVDGNDELLAIPRVPEGTWGVGAILNTDLGNSGALVSRVNFQHRDELAYTDNNFGWVQAADMLSANISWETPMDGVSLAIYGSNLLDEVQVGNDTQVPFPGPLSNGVNRPFDLYPAAGTFSPLKKGRLIGLELTIQN